MNYDYVNFSGIGDLLLLKVKNNKMNNLKEIVICKDFILIHRNNNIKFYDFILYLVNKLFKDIPIKLIDTNYLNKPLYNFNMENITDYDLSNLWDLNKIKLPEKYIVFTTKVRLDHISQEEINFIRSNLSIFVENFKCKYPIILEGERKIDENLETKVHNIFSIYDILLKLKNNNIVMDLTQEVLTNSPEIEDFEKSLEILNKAECLFNIGIGGNFCMNICFGKKIVSYINIKICEDERIKKLNCEKLSKIDNFDNFLNEINKYKMTSYYGQFNPPTDYILEKYYIGNIREGVGIECGSYNGVTESNLKFFEENYDWQVYNIEASTPIFEELCSKCPKAKNFNIGLGDRNTVAKFKHAIHPNLGMNFGNGSFNHSESHLKELNKTGCSFIEFDVPIKTYKTFIEENNIKKVDCFVLDVEGFELNVIDGMIDCDVLPNVFMIEYPHIGLDNLKNKLEEKFPNVYRFDKCFHNNAYFLKN